MDARTSRRAVPGAAGGARAAGRAEDLGGVAASALDASALLRRLAIRCDLTKVDSLLVARDNAQAQQLKREHQARVDAGLDAIWVNARKLSTDLHADDLIAAIRTKNDSLCDPTAPASASRRPRLSQKPSFSSSRRS